MSAAESSAAEPFTRTPVYRLEGSVVRGFGRGSKLLGFPTANLDPVAFKDALTDVSRGVYFGWAQIPCDEGNPNGSKDAAVHKAFISLGTNPQFNTVEDTVEAYILHTFAGDFYGKTMRLLICGHIRPMCAFNSLDSLIEAINNDVAVGAAALDLPDLALFKDDAMFTRIGGAEAGADGQTEGQETAKEAAKEEQGHKE